MKCNRITPRRPCSFLSRIVLLLWLCSCSVTEMAIIASDPDARGGGRMQPCLFSLNAQVTMDSGRPETIRGLG